MGSLFLPVTPTYSPMVYTSSSSVSSSQSGSPSDAGSDDGDSPSQTQQDNLRDFIRRTNRGRNSLIQTSYRGVLNDMNDLVPQRKTLLGE